MGIVTFFISGWYSGFNVAKMNALVDQVINTVCAGLILAALLGFAHVLRRGALKWFHKRITRYNLTNIRVCHNGRNKARVIANIINKSKANSIVIDDAPLLWMYEEKIKLKRSLRKKHLIPLYSKMYQIIVRYGEEGYVELLYHDKKEPVLHNYKYAAISIKPSGCLFSRKYYNIEVDLDVGF